MNSGLQCLINTNKLREYFISKRYLPNINTTNPIGTGGKLVKGFADLINNYWSGEFSVITPRDFKQILGRFAVQFQGFGQQDSQEFISYLLDGLHEDLNRIKKKTLYTRC
eukprot:Anaeramoba_flamelloidesa137904_9.p1 GENE.a137904_9~~a137904_9.p1  ORF type:complete len:110 (+),score=19.56 a137904_9:3-332(+)